MITLIFIESHKLWARFSIYIQTGGICSNNYKRDCTHLGASTTNQEGSSDNCKMDPLKKLNTTRSYSLQWQLERNPEAQKINNIQEGSTTTYTSNTHLQRSKHLGITATQGNIQDSPDLEKIKQEKHGEEQRGKWYLQNQPWMEDAEGDTELADQHRENEERPKSSEAEKTT